MFRIAGGNKLSGQVEVSGAKNCALKVLTASVLLENCTIENVPDIEDCYEKQMLLIEGGMNISYLGNRSITLDSKNLTPEFSFRTNIRTTILLLGPLLARFGYARIPCPKGDKIGERKINLHLDFLKKMGAEIEEDRGFIKGTCKKMIGIEYTLPMISVGTTEHVILTAALAHGTTIINNAAIEPEIQDLLLFLERSGLKVSGRGSSRITIEGTGGKLLQGTSMSIMPDRNQVIFYLLAAFITDGDIKVRGTGLISALGESVDCLLAMGAGIECTKDYLRCWKQSEGSVCHITTKVFPGFSSDMHPLFVAAMCLSCPSSSLTEKIFEPGARFAYVEGLRAMGAEIKVEKNMCSMSKIDCFNGSALVAPDIRAGATYVLAGLSTKKKEQTTIRGTKQILRGYDNLLTNLSELGASFEIDFDK